MVVSPFILLLPFFPSLVFKRLVNFGSRVPQAENRAILGVLGLREDVKSLTSVVFIERTAVVLRTLFLLFINGEYNLVITSLDLY